jgi:hypothetical protein
LHDGTVLAQCSGPAPGHESSLRSEGHGMLSNVRFLQHIFEYCEESRARPFRFITDNQGLIGRVMTSLAYDNPYPNSTLAADWDVVNEIVTTLKKMPIEHSFQHVKGHQDDKIMRNFHSTPNSTWMPMLKQATNTGTTTLSHVP